MIPEILKQVQITFTMHKQRQIQGKTIPLNTHHLHTILI